MEFSKKIPALLFLDKNGFYFYQEGLPNIVSLAFAENAVKDMDIISSTALQAQIQSFVGQYNILLSQITIVLSPNVIFEKDITGLSFDLQETAVKDFLETIPFESVLSKTYPIDKGVKVIGINEDLYLELKSGFEKSSFSIESLLPYQMLGPDQTLIKNLTTDTASQFLKRSFHLKQNTMLVADKEKQTSPTMTQASKESTQKPKKLNVRLFAMIGVFAVLFAILGFMLLNMGKS